MNNEQKEQMIKTNAFYGVSFDPEKRLERFIDDFENEDANIEELCQIYGVDSQKLKDLKIKSRPLTVAVKNRGLILNLPAVRLNMTLRKFAIISFLTKNRTRLCG